ncbi:hypothetical protein FNV43_RR18781 [Rhamnella rubrinervis]|uniref:Uncharacterized protein n=1 Tax=Rhamnella rubrinervis TaxID=2594499 RepID=A0A8K0EBH2_9ROSA|nr:hypothetical protein FNV43_RR18781 [Rhamnella rubrinervis]
MATASQCKRLLVVTFVLLFFISITACRARVLKAADSNGSVKNIPTSQDEKVLLDDDHADELVSMDYTPANKNPPIHN